MRTLSKSKRGGILFVPVFLLILMVGSSLADITEGQPGYPSAWEGMTTNTIIKIDLDRPVAMSDGLPDMDYTVKKAGFDGFDFIAAEVLCDVEVSDDRTTIRLYPQALLEQESFYAYKFERIAFGDGTEQEYTQCYTTGSNPSQFLNEFVSEIDMCEDSGGGIQPKGGSWCSKCHFEWRPFNPCEVSLE